MSVTSAARAARTSSVRSEAAAGPQRRRDIDALRGLAVALVVVYHVWLGRVSGGVDVLLLLSAFFLTDAFLRRVETGRDFSAVDFWWKRFSRLIPLVAVTIGGVLVTAFALYPPSRWHTVWSQSWASLFSIQNWSLIASSADYYARGDATSPLQHLWSLSIQAQVFLVWPVLLLAAALVARRRGWGIRFVTGSIFVTVFLVSFVYSVGATALNQEAAYFDTFARIWEFALGSLIAVILPYIRMGAAHARLLVAVGIAGLLSCGIVLDLGGGFPGFLALWPTLSAVAVVVGGTFAVRGPCLRLLASGPLVGIGAVSYALYLVHWPVLVTWLVISERSEAGFLSGFGVVAISLVLAVVLTRFVDRPLSRLVESGTRLRRPLAVVLSIVLIAAPLAAWQRTEAARVGGDSAGYPGARGVITGEIEMISDQVPIPTAATIDHPWFEPGQACGESYPDLEDTCWQVPAETTPTARVLVLGSSHAQQLGAALELLALRPDWELTIFAAGGCTIGTGDDGLRAPGECERWREAALSYVAEIRPDIVVTVGTITTADSQDEFLAPGLEDAVARLRATADTRVLLLRDNPRYGFNMYECGERRGIYSDECAVAADELLASVDPLHVFDEFDGVESLDLGEYLCPGGRCLPAVGNVFVYFDDNHVTTEYARSMSWVLEDTLRDRFGIS